MPGNGNLSFTGEKVVGATTIFFGATMADILILPCTRTGTGIGTGTSNGCPT